VDVKISNMASFADAPAGNAAAGEKIFKTKASLFYL
jgi:hypothetical protein